MRTGMRAQLGAVATLILLLAACGTDDGTGVRTIGEGTGSASASGTGTGASGTGTGGSASGVAPATVDPATADTRVNATLREFTLTPQPAEVPAGVIAFDVKNEGSVLHELVVLRAASAEALPVAADGSAEEHALGAQNVLGEIEVPVGGTGTVAFRMAPGDYVLICNIADDTGVHFKEGMHASFEVT
ncbi:MAG: hypothetical protein ACRDYA_18265 [Egibacteraceae bacterium]